MIRFLNTFDITHTQMGNATGHDDLRPVMSGVYVDLIEGRLVCTDAHILMLYPIQPVELDGYEFNHVDKQKFTVDQCKIVPLELFNKSKYMGNYKNYPLPIHYALDVDYARVFVGDKEVFKCEYIDGKYPNYAAVIPSADKAEAVAKIGVNLRFVERLKKAFPSAVNIMGCKFTFFAPNRCIIVTPCDPELREIKGLVMPVMLND